ncbi:MAG: cell envelope integrity protein CreD, partial [Bacteroidetes bacterium]
MIDLFERILRSSGFKFTLIGLLSLLLLIPVTMIRDLISERQERSREATLEVSEKWGLPQTVTGPFITFPVPGKPSLNGESSTTERKLHLMPGRLDVTGEVVPSEKKRGIFRVVVYETSLNMTGIFNLDNDPAGLLPAGGGPDHPGYLNFGVSDLRGIREIGITVNGRVLDEVPGLFSHDLAGSGVHVRLPDEFLSAGGLNYDIRIVVAGSSELYFTPLGRTTTVDLSSTWSDPSFDGAFLPGSREISQQGFTAQWKVNELNRNYPQVWYDRDYDVSDSRFGVRFLVP